MKCNICQPLRLEKLPGTHCRQKLLLSEEFFFASGFFFSYIQQAFKCIISLDKVDFSVGSQKNTMNIRLKKKKGGNKKQLLFLTSKIILQKYVVYKTHIFCRKLKLIVFLSQYSSPLRAAINLLCKNKCTSLCEA